MNPSHPRVMLVTTKPWDLLRIGKIMLRTKIVRLSQALCFMNTAIWLALSILSLSHLTGSHTMPLWMKALLAVLMLGNAAAFLIVGLGLGKSSRWYYILALTLVVINVVTSLTDQMGLLDWSVLGLNMILLGLLVSIRRAFL